MKYRPDIDGLRAVAIIPVVVFHAGLGLSGGFVGVDIFFVISGYLLSSIIMTEMAENRFSFAAFYERRVRRLAPAMIVMLALCFPLFALLMIPEDFVAFARSAIATVFVYANFHFYLTDDYFSQAANLLPLLHMWSLAIEEQFYAALPLALLAAGYVLPKRWLPALIIVLLVGSLALCVYFTYVYKPRAFYMPYTRAWELLAGTLLAALPRLSGSLRMANALGLAAFFAIAWVVWNYDERDAFPGFLAVVPVVATVALIYCGGVAPTSLPTRILSLPVLVFVGRISYSLYLWHWPIIVFANYGNFNPESIETKLVCVALSFLVATLSWSLVEEPIRRRRMLTSRSSVFASAAGSLGVVVVAASLVIAGKGLPGRVPGELRAFLDERDLVLESADGKADSACFFDRKAAESAAGCLRGAPGQPPSFFLVGDSHANALSPGLFQAAQDLGIAGIQYSSPGFLPGVGRSQVGARREDARIGHVLELIRDNPEIRTVIFSGAWADYATGTNWKGKSWLYQDDISVATQSSENSEIFARSLQRLVSELPDRRIIFLDDVPAGVELDLGFFVRRSMLGTVDRSTVMLPYEKAAERRLAYEPILQDLSSRNGNVSYMPVFSDFCIPPGCPLFSAEAGFPIYRDGDHLSIRGALMWKDRFHELLRPIP